MYHRNWFVNINVTDLEFQTFVLDTNKLFTNLGSLISVLYCTSLIRYKLKMDYLHLNGSFLVVEICMGNFAWF